jgi:hypothetical protein
VTERGLVSLRTSKFRPTKPVSVLGRSPLGPELGGVSIDFCKVPLGDERLWVHKKFVETLGIAA